VFCNPPYGQARDRWVERCVLEGRFRRVVLLIPGHTETWSCQRALGACTANAIDERNHPTGMLRSKEHDGSGPKLSSFNSVREI
jgi:hypothetical protein